MFFKAVSPEMKDLLDKFAQNSDIYKNFYLAGGTALSLILGHRKSFDFDFFTEKTLNNRWFDFLRKGKKVKIILEEPTTFIALLNDIKISFFYYPYPRLKRGIKYLNLELASLEDIACMKIIAISQRAEKKDFFDMKEIMERINTKNLIGHLIKKYGRDNLNCYHILRSFFYFQDVENSIDPIILNKTSWNNVKNFFLNKEKEFSKYLL